jgi:NADH:ubiquinone oxidoreductase subunit 4 (subunit M)
MKPCMYASQMKKSQTKFCSLQNLGYTHDKFIHLKFQMDEINIAFFIFSSIVHHLEVICTWKFVKQWPFEKIIDYPPNK